MNTQHTPLAITDTDRLEFLMGRMHRKEHERYFEDGQPRQEWHMAVFSIPRDGSIFRDWMTDMRKVVDVAIELSKGSVTHEALAKAIAKATGAA